MAELVGKGSTLILNISSSPYTLGKRGLRHDMLGAVAKDRGVPVVYVNQVGGNDSLIFDGSSVAFTPDGRVAALAKSFEEDLVYFDSATGKGDIRPAMDDEYEAAYRALVIGTRDYVRKCGFRKVVIGLSGGIDSALVAVIAVDALGAGNVQGVAMPGPYSSEGSLRDAKQLAQNLGIELTVLPITDTFASYTNALKSTFAGRAEDVTEENIQARIRGNFLMALSNKFGSLVLSTGNKSEFAVGYCTLYGDMAGGLSVISDVPKTMVYDLARLVNRVKEQDPAGSADQGAICRASPEPDRPGYACHPTRIWIGFSRPTSRICRTPPRLPRSACCPSSWYAPPRCKLTGASTSGSRRLRG